MRHSTRIEAIADHGRYFLGLTPSQLAVEVPSCPGWTVQDVVRHVAAFAAGCRAWCEIDDPGDAGPFAVMTATMAKVQPLPLDQLVVELDRYDTALAGRPPESPVWGHLGRESIAWHGWHSMNEWGIHRHDVETALGQPSHLTIDRSVDALKWTTDYVFPMIQKFRQIEPFDAVRLIADDGMDYVAGYGDPTATLRGSARDLLLHLWRRPHGPVTIEGNPLAARAYSGLAVGR